MSDKPVTEDRFLKAIEALEKGITNTLKENNQLIFSELRAMEQRTEDTLQKMENQSQARHEMIIAATKLQKMEFVTRQEFEKLKKEVHQLQAH